MEPYTLKRKAIKQTHRNEKRLINKHINGWVVFFFFVKEATSTEETTSYYFMLEEYLHAMQLLKQTRVEPLAVKKENMEIIKYRDLIKIYWIKLSRNNKARN